LVLCTHLHVDHVGWNTMLREGRWVPTFPNATYLIGGTEWDFFSTAEEPFLKGPVDDSVRPVVAAGMSQLVDDAHRLTDEVWLESAPGHTPGHFSVRISSRGEEAVITGDLMHHPILCRYPEWDNKFDYTGPERRRRGGRSASATPTRGCWCWARTSRPRRPVASESRTTRTDSSSPERMSASTFTRALVDSVRSLRYEEISEEAREVGRQW